MSEVLLPPGVTDARLEQAVLEENSYELGLLAADFTAETLPSSLWKAIKPTDGRHLAYTVAKSRGSWLLCNEAENRMREAIDMPFVTVIGESLMQKAIGKRAALCFESLTTSKGTFVAGNWYAPANQELISAIDHNFDHDGATRLHIPQGDWVLLRQLKPTDTILLELVREVAPNLKLTLPEMFGRLTRHFVRGDRYESFT